MTDDLLLQTFYAGTLPPADFRHRDHVRLAWLLIGRHDRAEAERRLIRGLRALAERAGKPEKFDEALTRAWVAAIDAARREQTDVASWDALMAARPDLLDVRTIRAAAVSL
jgi:hypothetical protein